MTYNDVKQLEGEARWWADLVLQRIATHVSPQAAMPHYVCTGALAQQRVDPQQFVAHGRHHRLTWEAVANRTAALHESLRAELELAAQREDLDGSIRRELTGWMGALSARRNVCALAPSLSGRRMHFLEAFRPRVETLFF